MRTNPLVAWIMTGALIAGPQAHAQAGASGASTVTGSIPKATFLMPTASTPAAELQDSSVASSSRVRLRIRSTESLPVELSLLARSNTAYRISGRLVVVDGGAYQDGTANVTLTSVRGTGSRVAAGAAATRTFSDLELSSTADTALLEGSRISRGGTNSSNDNALLMQFSIVLPAGVRSADLILNMEPQG